MEFAEGDGLPPQRDLQQPVAEDAGLQPQRRQLRQVVGAVQQPGGQALELDAVDLGRALEEAQTRDRARVAVPVVGLLLVAEVGDDVVREDPGLADNICLLYTSPSPRDRTRSRMPSSA